MPTPNFLAVVLSLGLASQLGCGSGVNQSFSQSSHAPASTDILASATIGSTPGVAIASDFVGISHEWGVAHDISGLTSRGRNMQYRQLLKNLLQYSTKPMLLRIGGNSTDTTIRYRASDLESLTELSYDLSNKVQFTLGVNMASDNRAVAIGEIRSITAAVPKSSVIGLELGNEPDSYVSKKLRPASYSFTDYLAQLTIWNSLVSQYSPFSAVSPALASYPWISDYEKVLPSANAPSDLVSQHFYPGEYRPDSPKSSDFLLNENNASAGPRRFASYAASVHAAGKKLRIGELNSLSNGGQPGLSDSFSSALWGLDIMFEFANAGIDGVNWQTGNSESYDLFQFSWRNNSITRLNDYTLVQVYPLFYSIQLFLEATSVNGRLLPVSYESMGNVKIWALRGDDGLVRIVVINKELSKSGTIVLHADDLVRGDVLRLRAPSVSSKTQVTLGEQTYDGSTNGLMRGTRSTEGLQFSDGVASFNMPPFSAALLTISK